jgi:FkbM family methyltransferase
MSEMKRILGAILIWTRRTFFPKHHWRLYIQETAKSADERELALLPALVPPGGVGIDVGAEGGAYSIRLVQQGASVIAFEPRPLPAKHLSEMATVLGLPIKVEPVALSNHSGAATLRLLTKDPGRSTIEERNELSDPDHSPKSQLQVEIRRLDDYGFPRIDLIKIDAEGHEIAVLEGANDTIARSRCSLLVEAEDRHAKGATGAVFAWMRARGYAGFFLIESGLHPVEDFDLLAHQSPESIGGWRSHWVRRGLYVNNFVFVPMERASSFLDRCHALGFAPPPDIPRDDSMRLAGG